MKKILFLLLFTVASYSQAILDEGAQITNVLSPTAPFVTVQETNGVMNKINKADLVNVVEVNDVPTLPLIGEIGKIYVVKNVNKIYRWNGTFYQELAVTDITYQSIIDALTFTPENVANKATDFTTVNNTLYPSVQAVETYVIGLRNSIYYRGKDIEFFGDSYTQGSGASTTANRWTSIVSRILGATEINHGVAGTTLMKRTPIDYMASPNMVDNVVNIPTKTASKAMLVFAFGLNDMGQTAPDYTTANYKTDYQFVLNNAYSKGWLPSQILIIPAYYIGSAGYAAYATITGNAAPTEARHLSFIQAAKEVASLNKTMYFDIYQDQKKNDITLLDPDNIHPSDAGYAYIANDVLQYLGQNKIGTTTNTTYDLKAGFVPNNNGSVFYNSLIYDSGARIGIGTITPQSTFHINSLVNTVDQRFTNSVTGSNNSDGTTLTVDLNADFVLNNYENKGVITATNNTIRNYTNNIGQTIFGGMAASNTSDKIQIIGSATATQWIADNGTNGSFFQGKNAGANLFVIGNDNAIEGGSINDLAYYSYTGNHKFYQPVFAPTVTASSFNGSATLTGTPTAPTAPAGTNTTQIATTAFVAGGLATKEPAFSKNTAFNKNFGTTVGTVVEGNDSRILNGQTAFGWGNHAGLYPSLTGTGANGTWGINISGNAGSATNWGGNTANFSIEAGVINVAAVFEAGVAKYAGVTKFQSWLGLGSNAYSSTAYLPLSGGIITGNLNVKSELRVGDDSYNSIINQAGIGKITSEFTSGRSYTKFYGHTGSAENALMLTIDGLGNSTFTGQVTASGFFQSSDRRLKYIHKRDGDVAYFKWKDGRDDKLHIGYVAQEVQENHPNQVQADEKGILSVNYVEILVEKIRVLEKRIEQLEKSK